MLSSNPFPPDHAFIDFCDRDANWGPLLFLRPERKQRIGATRTIAGAVLLGLPLGLLGAIVMSLFAAAMARPAPALMFFPLLLTLAYGVVGHITLARAWNQRAARLARFS
jgi:hypothetical protein